MPSLECWAQAKLESWQASNTNFLGTFQKVKPEPGPQTILRIWWQGIPCKKNEELNTLKKLLKKT